MKQIYRALRGELIKYSIYTVLLAVTMVGEAFIFNYIIDVSNRKNWLDYVIMVGLVLLFLVSQALLYYLQQFLTERLSRQATALYKERFFRKISQKNMLTLNQESKGKLISSLTLQMELLQQSYFYTIFWAGYLTCQLLIAIIMTLWLNPVISLMAIVLTLPNVLTAIWARKPLEVNQARLMQANDAYLSQTTDLINGLDDWKLNQRQGLVSQRFNKQSHDLFGVQTKTLRLENLVTALNNFFANLLYIGTWIIGAYFIIKGQLSLTTLVVFSQLLARISFPIYSATDLLAQYISGRKVLLELEDQLASESKAIGRPIKQIKRIDFLDYQFKNHQPLNLSLKAGQKYLLIGSSGSGKTSLVKHLLKLASDYQGQLLINDQKLEELDENQLYQSIHYLPQFPHIFTASLRENLTVFKDNIPTETIYQVLHQVKLDKWANPESLDRLIGDGNLKVSGGEIKRIALARFLLEPKSFLIVDELSAGLDQDTLFELEDLILNLPVSLIYISHQNLDRLGQQFDKIINLDELN